MKRLLLVHWLPFLLLCKLKPNPQDSLLRQRKRCRKSDIPSGFDLLRENFKAFPMLFEFSVVVASKLRLVLQVNVLLSEQPFMVYQFNALTQGRIQAKHKQRELSHQSLSLTLRGKRPTYVLGVAALDFHVCFLMATLWFTVFLFCC